MVLQLEKISHFQKFSERSLLNLHSLDIVVIHGYASMTKDVTH